MNPSLGIKLFGFKFLALIFIFLGLMPPFSFANLMIALVGLSFCYKTGESAIKKNGNFKLWASCSLGSCIVLGLVIYANN